MPVLAVTVVYWLHMLATILWLGSLAALELIVFPAARRALSLDSQIALYSNLNSRLESLSWLCLFLLVGTGMFQMSADVNFSGLISTENTWSFVLLVKHLLVLVIAGFNVTVSWGSLPDFRRLYLRYKRNGESQELLALQGRLSKLMRVSLILALAILFATAVMQSL